MRHERTVKLLLATLNTEEMKRGRGFGIGPVRAERIRNTQTNKQTIMREHKDSTHDDRERNGSLYHCVPHRKRWQACVVLVCLFVRLLVCLPETYNLNSSPRSALPNPICSGCPKTWTAELGKGRDTQQTRDTAQQTKRAHSRNNIDSTGGHTCAN